MSFVIPDDYDKAYLGSPHMERLLPHGKVRVYTDPPRDEGELTERLRPAGSRVAEVARHFGMEVCAWSPRLTADRADHRWAGLPNVVLTSHRGWVTRETLDRFMGGAVENALAFLAGRPVNVVNPEALQ